jgi:ribosomal protein L30
MNVIIEQVRSSIGRNKRVLNTLSALGLGRVGKRRSLVLNSSTAGMIKSVMHLVQVSESN